MAEVVSDRAKLGIGVGIAVVGMQMFIKNLEPFTEFRVKVYCLAIVLGTDRLGH